jgi:formate hydrogenlyase subunit 3/multisubunit Na+/H+ antiporter MnhD subunit
MAINELSLLILVPLIAAVVNLFLPIVLRKILTVLAVIYLIFINYQLFLIKTTEAYLFNTVIFSLDQLSFFILTFIQVLSSIILIFSLKGVKDNIQKSFFVLYPMTIAFCNGVAVSVNSISLLIFWGLTGITLYLFAVLGSTKDAPDTAKKTMVIVGGSDVFLILGLILIWFMRSEKSWIFWDLNIPLTSGLAYVAFFSILIAAFAKAGAFPLHSWVPDFAKDSPVESAAFLPASLDKLLGIYLLARLVLSTFVLNSIIHLIIITLGALTVITAVMMAMIQHNGRKLLGYHAVSQVGYMVMGVGSGNILAIIGGLFHMVNHTLYKSNLFLSLGAVEKRTGTNNLDELGGLGTRMPLTFLTAIIGAFAISGIPPFNGFYSKWLIYQGILDFASKSSPGFQIWLLICLILAIFGSALTLASFMKFIHSIFLSRRPEKLAHIHEAPFNQWLATVILSLLCIGFGIFAKELPLKHFILPVMNQSGLNLLGSYNPLLLLGLFGLALIIGLMIYWLTRKVRFDEIYLGGMEALEHFRVTGTNFYNEIRNMKPLKGIYNSAEKKHLDIYDLSRRFSLAIAKIFSEVHNGQLLFYNLWLVLGLLILLLVAI